MRDEKQGCVLAEAPLFGCVFDCGCCGNIHLTIGAMSLLMAPDDYRKLIGMIQASANRFEAWHEEKQIAYRC